MPYEPPNAPKSPFGWNYFVKSIPGLTTLSAEKYEIIKATMTLAAISIIQHIYKSSQEDQIQKSTDEIVVKYLYQTFSIKHSKIESENDMQIFDKIFTLSSLIIGKISDSRFRRFLIQVENLFLIPFMRI